MLLFPSIVAAGTKAMHFLAVCVKLASMNM